MIRAAVLIAAIVLSGCAVGSTSICTHLDDGSFECCQANYGSLFKKLEGVGLNACSAKAIVGKSNVDAKALESIISGAVRGAMGNPGISP